MLKEIIVGQDYFLTVSGLALALAGFSGLVSSFRSDASSWKAQDIAGHRFIFENSFSACFFALLPFPVLFSGASLSLLSKICGGLLAAFLIIQLAVQGVRIARLRREGNPARMEKQLVFIILPVSAITGLLIIYSSFCQELMWGFSWGLLWLLSIAGIQFFVFIWKGIN